MTNRKMINYLLFIFSIIIYFIVIINGHADNGRQIKNSILPWSKYEKKYFAFNKNKQRDYTNDEYSNQRKIKLYLPPFKHAKKEHISSKDTFGGENEFTSMHQNLVGSGGNVKKINENIENEVQPIFKYKQKPLLNIVDENEENNNINSENTNPITKPILTSKANGIGNAFPKRPIDIDGQEFVSQIPKKMKYEVDVPRNYFPKLHTEIPAPPKQVHSFNNMVPFSQSSFNKIPPSMIPSKQSSVTTFTGNNIPPIDLQPLTNPFFNIPQPSQEIISPVMNGIETNGLQNAFSAISQRFMPQPSNLPIQPSSVNGPTNSLGAEAINMLLGNGNGGSPLENISKIARNFLSMQGSNQDLMKLLTGALNSKNNELLTSKALFQTEKSKGALKVGDEEPDTTKTEEEDLEEENTNELITSSSSKTTTLNKLTNISSTTIIIPTMISSTPSTEATDPYLLLNSLPPEQREILQAAISSGELDVKNVLPTLEKQNNLKNDLDKNNTSSKLAFLKNNESKLLEWIQQNRPRLSNNMVTKKNNQNLSSDKLPYYGKYCGTLTETGDVKTNHNIAGAIWAVDDRRFIVSNFHYRPGSVFENITFWAGPKNVSNTISDAFPSTNGFYIKPKLVDLSAFRISEVKNIKAKIREPLKRKESKIVVKEYDGNTTDLESILSSNIDDFVLKTKKEDDNMSTLHLSLNPLYKNGSLYIDKNSKEMIENDNIDNKNINMDDNNVINNNVTSLEWYAGFQPLILELPDDKWVKTTNWVSIWDHKQKKSLASVLIPNGPAFQIPSIVLLKSLTPIGNRKISSGPITVLDTKTIEIKNFYLDTEGVPVWFMIGKDIIPNSNGLIVPTYLPDKKEYDCDSLRNYYNETVLLHLPESFDITDVFWFSVFSIPKSISFSHIYLPYNDMHLPPNLMFIKNPKCIYEKEN
ncbi:DM13 domain-containing protein [Strongyloides ratti]|uniref:DM13 domain-containing protein n=1 Tax=Strongyloides ratti TaxID=34506 RepID=A0A090LSI4_STRRB|nr:DM13 domain-containing protein [Strongyloides ratti]CEF71172.1 DM13 domain-containing protein [Strongyloides ratti]